MTMKWKFEELRASLSPIPSVNSISKATGIGRSVLRKMQGVETRHGELVQQTRVDLHTIDRLLEYFTDATGEELTTTDLLEWERE